MLTRFFKAVEVGEIEPDIYSYTEMLGWISYQDECPGPQQGRIAARVLFGANPEPQTVEYCPISQSLFTDK